MTEIVRRKATVIRYIKLVAVALLCFTGVIIDASSEFESLALPKCTPHGEYRAGETLDVAASRAKGAKVEDYKYIWLHNASECISWCCRLDAGKICLTRN